MGDYPFKKMHGLGNDFVVVDIRADPLVLSRDRARTICDRRLGVGCDQLLAVEPPANGRADAFMRIYNADGSEAGACGNGTRCVADLLMAETDKDAIAIETIAGVLTAERCGDGRVAVDMGPATAEWQLIPLARAMDTDHLDLTCGPLSDPVAVNVGNPHAVFFVDDAAAVPLETLGPELETDPLFPDRANIGVVQVLGPDRLRFRVWERGAGITRACGSGACAAVVAAARRHLIAGRRATVVLDGGALDIDWREDGHVIMTGPVATSYHGRFAADLLQ
ncbi:MAG: diaminopimelate epimerase [Alphaproteobacteria bacterium]|nr:diaminopimelate epimerase [Alphaproteobacteria bacterium]